jgi:hypothetical protein
MVAVHDVAVTRPEKRGDCRVTDVWLRDPEGIPVTTEFFDWHQLVTAGSHRAGISTSGWPAFS